MRTHACVKKSVRDEEDVVRAVQIVHTMIDREIAAGTDPEDVFVFGLSQGGSRMEQSLAPCLHFLPFYFVFFHMIQH